MLFDYFRFMERQVVDNIVFHAGQQLLSRDKELEGALHLFLSAGRFVEVLSELMGQLAQVLDPQHPQRAFWIAAAQGFYEQHLRPGNSYVVQRIEESGRMDLVSSFHVLLNLTAFVDLAAQGR